MTNETTRQINARMLANWKLRDASRAKDPDYDEKSRHRPSPSYDASIERYNDGSMAGHLALHFGIRPESDWRPRQESAQFTSTKTGKTYVWQWDTVDDIAPTLPGRTPDGGRWLEVMKKI
jgi:hypothetical protein